VGWVDGFDGQFCWAAEYHIGSMDSHNVKKGGSVVAILKEGIVEHQVCEIAGGILTS
jgi:hypothetical protein